MVTRLCFICGVPEDDPTSKPYDYASPRLNFFPANINAMRPTPNTLKLPAKLVDELGGYGKIGNRIN
jgi:hypothetical protein